MSLLCVYLCLFLERRTEIERERSWSLHRLRQWLIHQPIESLSVGFTPFIHDKPLTIPGGRRCRGGQVMCRRKDKKRDHGGERGLDV